MINLARYIQCHPSFRALRSRHNRTVCAVFLIFCLVFMLRDWLLIPADIGHAVGGGGGGSAASRTDSDEILFLKSQIGYLKSKLAKAGGDVDANDASMPVVFCVTPTYARPVQKAELTRLCQTFLLVPNLHWIVVEDAKDKTPLVSKLLKGCGVSYTHLSVLTPAASKVKDSDPSWFKPKGVLQRNEGLDWLRRRAEDRAASGAGAADKGVIYFADDDNTYSIELFEQMRYTKKVSVWAVGLVGGLMVEKPRLDSATGRVSGWDVGWNPMRPFPCDMAAFATNLRWWLKKPKARFSYRVKRGMQESEFLQHLVTLDDLEVKGDHGRQVLVWHTRTERVNLEQEDKRTKSLLPPSNAKIEV